MQSSINHVVVLDVFFSPLRQKLGHINPPPPPNASACHFTRSSAWARHTKDDICIGLCGGELAYCSCLLSLLHSFLSVTQFFNLYLLREGFLCMFAPLPHLSLPLSETSCFIFMFLHTFTPGSCRVQAQTLPSRSTWAVWRPHVLLKLVVV